MSASDVIARLRELRGKATAGRWDVEDPMGPDTLTIVSGGPEVYQWRWIASVCSDDPDEIADRRPDSPPPILPEEMQANAAAIVAAMNSLESLLACAEALEAMLEWFEPPPIARRGLYDGEREAIAQARAALDALAAQEKK